MCGILGIVSDSNIRINEERIGRALNMMRHRGPDFSKFVIKTFGKVKVCLGHTRLSIIDLSQTSHQPMMMMNRYILTYNGEIYNYIELRKELERIGYVFSTNSDTEVLLAALIEWQECALTKLMGMFAFAFLDIDEQTIICARDPFGVKPLYWSLSKERFGFASEIRPLLEILEEKPILNKDRGLEYLLHGFYDFGGETFFEKINILRPGYYIKYNFRQKSDFEMLRWWYPDFKVQNISFDDAAGEIRRLFLESVKMHLRSDVPVGFALSGGIDSSAVVCAARKIYPDFPIKTFSFISGNENISEQKWVDLVNKDVGAQATTISLEEHNVLTDIDEVIQIQGEPFGSTSILAQYMVFKAAKEFGVVVTLDGQGADEILGGYTGFPFSIMRSYFEKFRFIEALSFYRNWKNNFGRNGSLKWRKILHSILPFQILNFQKKVWRRSFVRVPWLKFSKRDFYSDTFLSEKFVGRRLWETLYGLLSEKGLPALLRHADRNSMAFSLESRVPFLSLQLVQYMMSLPEDYLVSEHGRTKHIFREALKGVVPSAILERKDKIGFETEEEFLLRSNAATLRTLFADAEDVPIFNVPDLLQRFDAIIDRKIPFSGEVWRWLNFIKWYRFNRINY